MNILGPCSVESKEQMESIIKFLLENEINFEYMRGGIWKPRTNPGQFDGLGEEGLKIIQELKRHYDFKFITEVALSAHLELAFKYQVDAIWIGARTTTNPFLIDNLAQAISSHDKNFPIFIKNPINPDVKLWMGAVERFKNKGLNNIHLIHRGFQIYPKGEFRNEPIQEFVDVIKENYPELKVIADPSHIIGDKKLIINYIKNNLELFQDGLMIEMHPNPKEALSDAHQQLNFNQLLELKNLL